jgi:hypothetical protein
MEKMEDSAHHPVTERDSSDKRDQDGEEQEKRQQKQ